MSLDLPRNQVLRIIFLIYILPGNQLKILSFIRTSKYTFCCLLLQDDPFFVFQLLLSLKHTLPIYLHYRRHKNYCHECNFRRSSPKFAITFILIQTTEHEQETEKTVYCSLFTTRQIFEFLMIALQCRNGIKVFLSFR